MRTIPDTRHVEFFQVKPAPRNALNAAAPLKPKPAAKKSKAKPRG